MQAAGRDVKLVRTTALASQALAAVTSRARRHMIVQRFLDTGTYSQDYRVVTLFGNPLYALKRKSLIALPDLEQTEADTLVNGVVSNSTAGEREVHYCYDKDVLDFAKTVYRAIPEVPLQALDVRRDRNDGRLYCLEINPGGYTWNFSSRRAKATPTIDGIRREDQLGAWEIAAKALIEQTRLHAS
jgi:glutathione synthase/RimK-type ligase-like ATP-grasp enzyme